MKTQKTTTATLMMIAAMMLCTSLQAQDPREIIRKMEDNMRGDAMYSELTMETVRPRYTREISLKSWSLGDDYSLIYVTAPARDKGTAFLKRGNEIWNYVPNIDRTVKMPPSMMSQSWMGSDFTNDDLVRGVSTVDDYTHTLLGSEIVDGHNSYKIEMIPKPEAPVVFEKVIYWISKEHYLPVKVENYDEFGDLVSTINFRDIKNMGGRMIPAVVEMIPEGRPGHKTILITHKSDYNITLTESFFSQQRMREVR
jgi:outer membrane lipoprotein-sorting protein